MIIISLKIITINGDEQGATNDYVIMLYVMIVSLFVCLLFFCLVRIKAILNIAALMMMYTIQNSSIDSD